MDGGKKSLGTGRTMIACVIACLIFATGRPSEESLRYHGEYLFVCTATFWALLLDRKERLYRTAR
jgi:hypothetical protein